LGTEEEIPWELGFNSIEKNLVYQLFIVNTLMSKNSRETFYLVYNYAIGPEIDTTRLH
jgi:hypothetical protein